jgi:hypothetical protein
MLVGERKADDFEILLLDDLAQAACGLALFAGPQAVAFYETQRAAPPPAVVPGWSEGPDPEPRDSPMRNCAS